MHVLNTLKGKKWSLEFLSYKYYLSQTLFCINHRAYTGTVLMPVEYAVVVVRLVQIQYTCVLEEKTRQNSARIFARVGHGEKGEGDEV